MLTKQNIKTFIFAPACYDLAETTRMLEVAKAMARHPRMRETIRIRFMSEGGEFEGLITAEGFTLDTIEPRVTPEKIAQIAAVNDQEKIGTIYSWREILNKVRGDTAFLAAAKPAASCHRVLCEHTVVVPSALYSTRLDHSIDLAQSVFRIRRRGDGQHCLQRR